MSQARCGHYLSLLEPGCRAGLRIASAVPFPPLARLRGNLIERLLFKLSLDLLYQVASALAALLAASLWTLRFFYFFPYRLVIDLKLSDPQRERICKGGV